MTNSMRAFRSKERTVYKHVMRVLVVILICTFTFQLIVLADDYIDVNTFIGMHITTDGSISSGSLPSYAALQKSADPRDQAVASYFGSEQKYNNWVTSVSKYAIVQNGSLAAKTTTDEGFAEYNSVINKYNSAVGRQQVQAIVSNTFGTGSFNPHSGILTPIVQDMFGFTNVVFSFVAKVISIAFLIQTAFDVLYMVFDGARPFLNPKLKDDMSAGTNGHKRFSLPVSIISHDVIKAVEKSEGMSSGIGSGGEYAGGGSAPKLYVKYRAPIVILSSTYLVLVSMNMWTQVIGFTSSITAQIMYNIFG